jgi:hypothetical protein
MSKYTIIGLISWVSSGVVLLFQTISSLTGTAETMVFKNLTLVSVVGQGHFDWINSLSWVSVQKAANYIVTMPLYLLLFCIGILFFLIHMFSSKL